MIKYIIFGVMITLGILTIILGLEKNHKSDFVHTKKITLIVSIILFLINGSGSLILCLIK